MSINEEKEVRKGDPDAIPEEEEFDIVRIGEEEKTDVKKHIFNVVIIVLIASASFGLGRFSFYKEQKVPVTLLHDGIEISNKISEEVSSENITKNITTESEPINDGTVVGSKNSDKYHYPWCSGAKNIAPTNLITFSSVEEARKAGYLPASNCKGLK